MLPHNISVTPSPSGRPRQPQHRRQNSTPLAAAQTDRFSPYTTSSPRKRQALNHRRGMSLDMRQLQTTTTTTSSAHTASSTRIPNTNQPKAGLATIPQHHVLREAQQHSQQQARPGPGSQQATYGTNSDNNSSDNNNNTTSKLSSNNINESNYLVSPHGTPQPQSFDPSSFDPNSAFDNFAENTNAIINNSQLGLGPSIADSQAFQLFAQSSNPLSSQMLDFADLSSAAQNWTPEGVDDSNSRKPVRRISGGIADQVNKYESMGMEAVQRASTPPIQTYNAYQPLTPTDTPNHRVAKHDQSSSRFSEGYDGSMEETIRPKRAHARNLSVFSDSFQQAMNSGGPSPPTSSTFPNPETFPGQLAASFQQQQQQQSMGMPFTAQPDYSNPNSPHRSQFSAPFETTPGSVRTASQSANGTPYVSQHTPTALSNAGSMPPSPSPNPRGTPHRRSESMASAVSAASISNINFDDLKTETGVSIEEIARYISGPDLVDGRWTCTFNKCQKKFGRKENIKSHVQTHLNDRQYVCPTCLKCFVRQHDLKRHAKIHTGIKPYPCECGNSFARHDALTRHRQRGMCVGAFDGIVKKNVKRGRPRKPRPDMDERREKSTRTRKKNMSVSSMSSQSGYTDSSAATTPGASMDMLADMDDMIDLAGALTQYDNSASSSAPMPSILTTADPILSEPVPAPSPAATSPHSYVSPHALMEKTPLSIDSPAHTEASAYHSPPPEVVAARPSIETDHAFLSLDADTSVTVERLPNLTASSSSIATSASLDDLLPPSEYSAHDVQSYLSFSSMDDLASLDRDPFKFEELFPDSGDMYGGGDPNSADPFIDYEV